MKKLRCRNCRKTFNLSISNGLKSEIICPNCGEKYHSSLIEKLVNKKKIKNQNDNKSSKNIARLNNPSEELVNKKETDKQRELHINQWGVHINNASISWSDNDAKDILTNINLKIAINTDRNSNENEINFNQSENCKIPILGKSGQGKSTLLYLISMLKRPVKGQIVWTFPDNSIIKWSSDKNISKEISVARKKNFGFAFQDNTLLPHLTIMDNLIYPQLYSGILKNEAMNNAKGYLDEALNEEEKSKIDSIMNRYPAQLSGGQKQRVALIQALITNPSVLFADEPTGNLDRHTRKSIMNMMDKWVKNEIFKNSNTDRLLIWVTHHSDDPENMKAKNILHVNKHQCKAMPTAQWQNRDVLFSQKNMVYFNRPKTAVIIGDSKEKRIKAYEITKKVLQSKLKYYVTYIDENSISKNIFEMKDIKRIIKNSSLCVVLQQSSMIHPLTSLILSIMQILSGKSVLLIANKNIEPSIFIKDIPMIDINDIKHLGQNIEKRLERPFNQKTKFPSQNSDKSLPFCIQHISIENFLCIHDASINHIPADSPWIFFLGENAHGKTALLQALTIGLCGRDNAAHLLPDQPDETLKACSINIREWGTRKEYSIYWLENENRWQKINHFNQLCAYGPSRLEIDDPSIDKRKRQSVPEKSLIDQRGVLNNIEYFLLQLSLKKDLISKNRFKNVIQSIIELLPNISEIFLDEGTFYYKEMNYLTTIEYIASGHKSIIAMVGDIISQFFSMQPDVDDPKKIEGIVIIDELDVHLHPTLQRDFPQLLSNAFPKIQFICSTHSPLPLLGAPEGAKCYVVERDDIEGTTINDLGIDINRMHPNSLLTSPYFNLEKLFKNISTLDPEDNYYETLFRKDIDQEIKMLAASDPQIPSD